MSTISDFDLQGIKKRFPKAYDEYVNIGGTDEWNNLCDWIRYKGQDPKYYPIALRKIENEL